MPIASKNDLANLALDHLGEPYLTDYLTDTGTTAATVRLHLDQCVETVLEGHVWSFATRCIQPTSTPAYVTATLTTNLTGANNDLTFTAVNPGTGGNEISITIAAASAVAAAAIAVSDRAITITPGTATTAADIPAAIAANADAALLVTCALAAGNDGSTALIAMAKTYLAGRSPYQSAFLLPSDCLRLLKINDADIDNPRQDFEIQGRYLLLIDADADAPVIHYITKSALVTEWPTTFTDAVSFLLASRLAPKLAQDQRLANDFLQKHEMTLGKARSKDARETRSRENQGPRQLAARSAFVRARYGSTSPPY